MEPINIYVMERGHVLVGRPLPEQPDALFEVLGDCAIIRVWGTESGLGQLALEGPTVKTILDLEPQYTRLRLTACYRILPCKPKAWARWRPAT